MKITELVYSLGNDFMSRHWKIVENLMEWFDTKEVWRSECGYWVSPIKQKTTTKQNLHLDFFSYGVIVKTLC